MVLTKKITFAVVIGSFLSFIVWILVQTFFGKGFFYNQSGLLFGLVLCGIAWLLYVLSFKLNKNGLSILLLFVIGLLFFILFSLMNFGFIQGH